MAHPHRVSWSKKISEKGEVSHGERKKTPENLREIKRGRSQDVVVFVLS